MAGGSISRQPSPKGYTSTTRYYTITYSVKMLKLLHLITFVLSLELTSPKVPQDGKFLSFYFFPQLWRFNFEQSLAQK